jgi:predicted MFS family arabinose efflux permease
VQAAQPGKGYRWLMLSLGWLMYFSFGLIHTAIAPLVVPIMVDLGLTYTQMGVITGAWQLIYIFSAQPLGMAIDRLGVHRSLLIGAAVVSASSSLRFFARGFGGLFASVALFGLGGPFISIGTPKLVSIWFKGEERGAASGINASGSAIGSVAALGLTNSFVLPLVGAWRNVFHVYGIFGFSVAFIWLLLGGRSPAGGGDLAEPPREEWRHGTVRELLQHRDIWLIVGIGVVFFLANHALQNWLPRILELKGMSPADAGYATSLMALSGIIGSLVIPRFSYRIGSMRSTIAVVILFSGASILLIGVGGGLSLLGITSAGFFTRALVPVLMVTLMDMPEVGAERMGTVGGLFFSIAEIGGFLGPFLMGYLKDLTGSFLSGIFFLAIVTEAAIIAIAFLKSGAK